MGKGLAALGGNSQFAIRNSQLAIGNWFDRTR